MSSITVVMPVFNESSAVEVAVRSVIDRIRPNDELIVVDGESTDNTLSVLQNLAGQVEEKLVPCEGTLKVVSARKGRGCQMNAGGRQAQGELLLFLHADTTLTDPAWNDLLHLAEHTPAGVRFWGRFDVSIQGDSGWFPVISWFMNMRSRLTHIATGDQAIFLTRALYNRIGGYFDQPLMEDVELCKTLKTQPDAVFRPLKGPVHTSGRRWEENGVWSTIVLMWRLRYSNWKGVNPYDLARKYRDIRRHVYRESGNRGPAPLQDSANPPS